MTAAGLRASDRPASRITVRPTGHPYSRTTHFNSEQLQWIDQNRLRGAQFLVVDEGPGRSGSTFLSVAEALVRAGVPVEQITMVGSRQPDLCSLCARDAATRWQRFRFISTQPSESKRFENCQYVGGGHWREIFLPVLEEWPESWTQMERLKFVSPDRRTLLKFEGMGPIGADVRERAFVLAEAGFSPTVSDAGGGFLCYALANGRRLGPQDVSDSLLDHMARYCAFRVETFSRAVEGKFELATMLAFNIRQEFGRELEIDDSELLPRAPVLCDGRMHPHEWVLDSAGELIKVDAIDHGDNHFFPGPCDIAWDIAGVATEWQLCAEGITALLEKLRRLSQIDVSSELPLYMLAYSVFSLGRCKMALSGPLEEGEKCRLHRAYDRYRCQAERLLAQVAPVSERLYVA